MLFWAIPWPMAGTLPTMAVPRADEASFWATSCWPTTEETPSWSKTGFLAIRVVTVWLAESVRPVAVCWRLRASVRERAWAPLTVVVAVLIMVCALFAAVRTFCRLVGSEALTA